MSATLTIEEVADVLATDICKALRHAADKREVAEICARALSKWGNHNCDETRRLAAEQAPENATSEAVSHPSHYGGKNNPYEARKVIRACGLTFNTGNAFKYIARAGKKDPERHIEDLEKAVFYLNDEISILRGDEW